MGETILISGAAKRLGAAMSRGLAARGHAVVIHYNKSAAEAAALEAEIVGKGGRAATVAADLGDDDARAGVIAAAAEPFGPLTVLINNASQFSADTPDTLENDNWGAHFGIHAETPAFLAGRFAAQLPADTIGNIVNMVDERVLRLSAGYFSYALSKQALWNLTRALALHFAPRIRVNAIGPGPSLKEEGQSDESFADSLGRLPLERGPDLEDFAAAVQFLLDSPSVTGQMIALDGGRHLLGPELG